MSLSASMDPVIGHSHESPYHKALKTSVSALLCEVGFVSAENDTLETLTEMVQSGKFNRLLSVKCCIYITKLLNQLL